MSVELQSKPGCQRAEIVAEILRSGVATLTWMLQADLLLDFNIVHILQSMQGRVRVVMNPSRYEIPSGSAYGYIIADNAEQARSHVCLAIDLLSEPLKMNSRHKGTGSFTDGWMDGWMDVLW
jgi:hypothetical protein